MVVIGAVGCESVCECEWWEAGILGGSAIFV